MEKGDSSSHADDALPTQTTTDEEKPWPCVALTLWVHTREPGQQQQQQQSSGSSTDPTKTTTVGVTAASSTNNTAAASSANPASQQPPSSTHAAPAALQNAAAGATSATSTTAAAPLPPTGQTLAPFVTASVSADGTAAATATGSGSPGTTNAAAGASYSVPLVSNLADEIQLSPELLNPSSNPNASTGEMDPGYADLNLALGDMVYLCKASDWNTDSAPFARDDPLPSSKSSPALIFKVEKQSLAPEGSSAQLQISLSHNVAAALGLENREQVVLAKLPATLPRACIADHVEVYFKDQYLGRADMLRISFALTDNCIYLGQKVQLAGLNIRARIGGIWVAGKQKTSALVTNDTRIAYRSESAKYFIFLQLSREMWAFDDDGSLFVEKAVDLFLPELFSRWAKRGTNHIVSIVLFSRLMYEQDEVDLLTWPTIQRTADNGSTGVGAYTDVYKVIVDLETNCKWPEVLEQLRLECKIGEWLSTFLIR